jgi:hypothetical protein
MTMLINYLVDIVVNQEDRDKIYRAKDIIERIPAEESDYKVLEAWFTLEMFQMWDDLGMIEHET